MEDTKDITPKQIKLVRCMDWLKNQNSGPRRKERRLSQSKNDFQFVVKTEADHDKTESIAENVDTVPAGVSEFNPEPTAVPLHRLRFDNLKMECEWQSCRHIYSDYEQFQQHVSNHSSEITQNFDNDGTVNYGCLWDVCGHKTNDYHEMIRHINYHSYHARLLAIGLNGRATLNLLRCKKESTKRNQIPPLPSEHCCLWTGCEIKFNSIQKFIDHVKLHVEYSDNFLCSWGGCGTYFPSRVPLRAHVRSHIGERVIACYHCGQHFACNRKLSDHLRRQNVEPESPHACSMCGTRCATEYLLNEHVRQHVSAHVCSLCDMSATTPAALAVHMRYRHLPHARHHACTRCDYRAVTKKDLRKHLLTHDKKPKERKKVESLKSDQNSDDSDEDSVVYKKVKPKPRRKYACHMCPKKNMKIFSRGTLLTTHLVKVHDAQWTFGHSRFRYQKSEDGMYRLTTTRYEVLEVSKKIVDRDSGPKEALTNSFEFKINQVSEPTETTPRRFEIVLLNEDGTVKKENTVPKAPIDDEISTDNEVDNEVDHEIFNCNPIEITMFDVDELGNVIKSEVVN